MSESACADCNWNANQRPATLCEPRNALMDQSDSYLVASWRKLARIQRRRKHQALPRVKRKRQVDPLLQAGDRVAFDHPRDADRDRRLARSEVVLRRPDHIAVVGDPESGGRSATGDDGDRRSSLTAQQRDFREIRLVPPSVPSGQTLRSEWRVAARSAAR